MKAHLLDSDEPLVAGQDQVALCGKAISKATFVMLFDTMFIDAHLSPFVVCRDCWLSIYERRYLYGLIDGEKAKHLEAEL